MAVLDPLTGLNNRRSGQQRLREEMSRAERYNCPLLLLLFDVDGLKRLNDNFGHLAGDRVISYFAHRLQKAIRGSDLAMRRGGDEFLVFLPECTEKEVQRVLGRDFSTEQYSTATTARPAFGWWNVSSERHPRRDSNRI